MPIDAASIIFDHQDGDYSDLIEVQTLNLKISFKVISFSTSTCVLNLKLLEEIHELSKNVSFSLILGNGEVYFQR